MARAGKEERKKRPEALAAIHKEALEGFAAAYDPSQEERKHALQDRRFALVAGAQYEGQLGAMFENKPKFECNKINVALLDLKGEYRKNRITVDFVPKDGDDSDELADVLDGLYRADETDTGGQEAYDTAFDEMASGGMGAWRLRQIEEDPDDEENEQARIAFEPIHDADQNVYFDVGAKKQDKSDAQECWVLNPIPRPVYETKYEDNPSDWPKPVALNVYDWCTPDVVTIAEYYRKVRKPELYEVWRSPIDEAETEYEAEDLDEPDDETGITKRDELLATGHRLLRTKKKKCVYVEKYMLSGGKVLSGPHKIPGKHIPVIVAYGQRAIIDGIERFKGLVRDAKDAQRLKNMQISSLAVTAATGGQEKPIFSQRQMAGQPAQMWAKDAIENYPYLITNDLTDPATGQIIPAGPIGYTRAPNIPPAMAALLQLTETDMADMLGTSGNQDEIRSNVSADAVELVQAKQDTRSYIYLDSFSKAMRWCGEVWLSMARELYVEEGRKMKTVAEDGASGSIELKRQVERNGVATLENDLKAAKHMVMVDVGPSSSSKRSATVRALSGMAQVTQDPQTQQVLSAAALMNMDGEGLQDIRAHFRKTLVRMGVVQPTEEESQEMAKEAANQQPDAQQVYLMAESQKAQSMAVKAQAETEKINAQTAEILAGISISERDQVLKLAQMISTAQGEMNGRPA